MYFVQEGDTIESIADRYETSVQNLYRVNQTEDIFLNTGQIIYIPVSRVRRNKEVSVFTHFLRGYVLNRKGYSYGY